MNTTPAPFFCSKEGGDMTTASTLERPRRAPPAVVRFPERPAPPHRQWPWLVGGAVMAFAVPFVFADLLGIKRDLYYGLYMLAVIGLCIAWARRTRVDIRSTLLRNWRWGVGLGIAFAGVVAMIVVRTEEATSHPDGIGFVAAILWRGVLYGVTDGLLLSVFPILVVFAIFRDKPLMRRLRGKAAVGALALAASLAFTAVYHLGYPEFRGEKLRKPIAGALVWSVPTLFTLSPIGSPIAHAGLHVSAVVHSYETETFLPPHASAKSRADLQRILDDITTGQDRLAPGSTAYVAWPGGDWSGAAGVANVKSRAPMEPDARMRLESVSKIWTATLVLQLVAEGKLQLADSVERWLPGVFPFGDRITILQLLTHTSGMFDDSDAYDHPELTLRRVRDPALRREFLALAERFRAEGPRITFPSLFLIRLAAEQPLYFEPGHGYHYSNIGFDTLGLIVSRVRGKSLAAIFEERIFRPLGLRETAYDPQGPIRGPHSRGYNIRPGGRLLDLTDAHPGKAADGGIVSNARDTATFLAGLMQGRLLSRPILRGMQTYAFWNGGNLTPCGVVTYGHGGAGDAFKTEALASEDGTRVAVLLLNARGDTTQGALAVAAATRLLCAGPNP